MRAEKRMPGSGLYAIPARRVADLPSRQRPREQLERVGAEHVSDEILLAVLLRSGIRGLSVVDLAQALLVEYGSLTALARASVEDLSRLKGLGKVKAQVLKAALELAQRLAEESRPVAHAVKTPEDAAGVLREKARVREEEAFWVLLLDAKNRLRREPVEITKGLLDASLVHPREVFKEAIRTSCAAIVLAHNHPSGDPTPSAEDIRITRQLVDAGGIVDIRVLDHIILGRAREGEARDFVSLREAGVVNFGV
jgi:DNA repair protein RadC